MKNLYLLNRFFATVLFLLLFFTTNSFAQRIYATTQDHNTSGVCIGCGVANPANAADGNLQTFSTINVTVGVLATSFQDLIFPAKVAANTPVSIKLGTGNNLINLTALGGVLLQAYNGTVPVGPQVAASTLLTVLSSNNQLEVSITPTGQYDRLRITLDAGLLGAAASYDVYEAFYNGTGSTACNAAVDELHGISTGLLNLGVSLGGVANPQLAIDGDLTTASTLNAGVGIVGAYAQQTIIYQTASTLGDSIKVTMSVPQSLLSAGVLSSISVTSFNGNTSNNDTQTLSSALLNVQLLGLLGSGQEIVATYAPTSIFDRVQITLGGGIANVLSTANLYEAQKIIPSPIVKYNGVATTGVQLCAGSTATLTASVNNALTGNTFNWYTTATGGTPVFTGASFTTPVLTANTTYYVSVMRSGCTDQSGRTAVPVTVNQIPAAPVIASNAVTICPGQPTTLTAAAVAGVTVNWYTTATGGTAVFTGNNFTTPALTQTTTYYAEAVAGGTCISPTRTAATVTISTLPATPALTANNVTICSGSVAVLSIASPVAGITYNWYSAATGGTPLYTGTTFTSPALTANTNYYVEGENATGCVSTTRAQATVTVQPLPADPIAAANNATVAAGSTTSITVTNAQTGVTYNWYTSATASTPIFTGTTFTTPALYSTTTYYVGAVNSTQCSSVDRTAVTINVTTVAAPCAFANQQSSSINGVCVGCGVTNNSLAIDGDTTTASTINVTVGAVGAYAEQTLIFQNPGLSGDIIKLGLQTPVSLATVGLLGQIQVVLFNGTTQVASYTLDNSLIKITLLSGGTKSIAYIPATGPYDRISVRLISTASVLSSLQVYYAIQQFPAPVINPTSPEVCAGSTAQLNITSPAVGTFNWFTTPTGGTSVFTGTNFTTPVLATNTTYYIEYTRNGCTSPTRFAVPVLVDTPPASPVASASNVTINSGQTATLNATAASGATIKWYPSATGGTALATGNTFTTGPLTANTTYYAEASLGSCTSTTRTPVTVTVNPVVIPDVTVTPATQAVNMGSTATLTASSTTPGAVFNWYSTATGGTSLLTGPTFTTPSLFANATYYAEATIPATGAVSATRAAGSITVNATVSSAVPCDAAIDQTTDISGLACLGCAINNPTGSVDADRNTFSQISVPVGLLAYAQQTLRFAATGRLGDSVVVELGIPGALASVGVLSQISLATYNGTTYNNDRFNVNGSLISISLISGTNRFRVAFKATADFDRVEVRLNGAVAGVLNALNIYDASEEVAAPTVAVSTVTVCQGSQATLTATVPSYETVKWYTSATGGTPVFTGATFNTPVLNASTIYYAEASRTADGCAQATRTPVTVTVTPVPVAPVVPVAAVTVCAGQPATFAVTPVTGVTYNWFSTPTGGTSLFTGNSFTTPALTATTSYYVEADGAGSCGSATRTAVTATVNPALNNAVVAQTPVQICAGTSAVLMATSTQPGVTFNWYTAATGGTPVFTGATFTTPVLTANTAYFVEAASGTCVSATRTEADVTVNPVPVAPTTVIVPAGGQIASGQTSQITASSTTPGATFNWYTTATGGTAIFTGATFTTPALTNSTTYYVEAASASGCTSPTRTAVTVTVIPIFVTTCDFVSSDAVDINGGLACVLCGVSNHLNASDQDTTNFSTLTLGVGVVNSYVAQSLIFSDAGAVGDTVKIKIGIPAGLLSANILGAIQVASYNGTTYNGDRINVSSNAISVQILPGGQTAFIKFAPQAAFDRVEVRLTAGVAAVLSSLNVYYASKGVEAPILAASTVNICQGATATFTVSNARAGLTYSWYDSPTSTTVLHTGVTFTTPALSATTTYYVGSSRTSNSCPNPNRVAATANVTAGPPNPVLAQNNLQICAGDNTTLTVTNATGFIVNWYDAATGGNLLFTGANFQVSPIANITYYAELTNGTCTSPSRTTATITVNPRPLMPGVTAANVQVCAGSTATLSVNTPQTGVTYNWYTAATGGTSVFAGTSFTTPAITQNTTYYVDATSTATGCLNNGGRTPVAISVTTPPAAPSLSATTTQVCSGGSATLSVDSPVPGLVYNWYTAATGGTLVFTGTQFTVNNLTASISYFVEAANSNGCTSATRTETDINVLPIPNAPVVVAPSGGLTDCTGSTTTISILNPQADLVYRWYTAATGGTLLYTGTQFTTPPLTATTTFYVEAASAGNCNPSARTAVTVTIAPLPPDPTVTANMVSVCAGGSASLSINAPVAGITYKWYDSPAETNLLFTGTTYITGPITNTTNFYVSAANSAGCSSTNTAQVQVSVQPPPSAPAITGGNAVAACNGAAVTLSIANPQNGYTYNWYTAATGGAAIFTGPAFTTPAVTASITYYAEAVNSTGCISTSRTAVNITLTNQTPPALSATNTQVCSGGNVSISVTNPDATLTYNWYTAATGGTLAFTGTTYNLTNLTASASYFVEAVTSTGCVSTSRTETDITVTPAPAAPSIVIPSGGLSVCNGSATTVAIANPQSGYTYNWYDAATGGTLLFTGTSFTTPVLTATTSYYVEADLTGNCNPSARTTATITVNQLPADPAVTANTVSVCTGNSATLSVSSPVAGISYNWYDSPAKTNLLFTGVTYTTGPITAATSFYVSANNTSGCSSANLAQVQVNVQAPPATPVIANGATVASCSGATVTLTIANPQAGYTYNWYNAATGTAPMFTGTTFVTPAVTANITYYAEAVNSTGCASIARASVNVTLTNQTPPTLSATATQVCSGGSTSISVVSPDAGTTYNWYTAATGGTLAFTGTTYNLANLTANISYFVEGVNSTGCVSTSRTETDITVLPAPTAPTIVIPSAGLSTCSGSATTVNIANPQSGYTYNWYSAATGGTPLFTGTAFTTPVLTATTSYYVEAAISSNCSPSARTTVTITVNQLPADPGVTANTVGVCSGSSALLSVSSPQSGITYNWYNSPAKTTILFTGPNYNTAPITTSAIFYVSAVSASGCSSANLAQVQVNVQATPPTPVIANGATTSTCSGSVVTLTIANPQSGYTYNWYNSASGSAPVFTGTSFVTPAVTASTTYYAEAINTTGCASANRASVNISVSPATPAPAVSAQGTLVCPGSATTLASTNTDANITIKWYAAATGGSALATGNSFTTPAITANTTYYAEATNNTTGCISPTRSAVNVQLTTPLAAPVASVGTTTASSIQFNWTSITGATGYEISLDNGLTFINEGTNLTYTASGLAFDQSVSLLVRATGATTCQTSANSASVTGKATNPLDDGIFVPNAFTPNGDGKNDILYVYGTNIRGLSLWIYDQWGEMQFKSTQQSVGWDGTYKGKAQPTGVYVYYLEATMNDGIKVTKKGTITLLR